MEKPAGENNFKLNKPYIFFRIVITIIQSQYIWIGMLIFNFGSPSDKMFFTFTGIIILYFYILFLKGKLSRRLALVTLMLMVWYLYRGFELVVKSSYLYYYPSPPFKYFIYLMAYVLVTIYISTVKSRSIKAISTLITLYILFELFKIRFVDTFVFLIIINFYLSLIEYYLIIPTVIPKEPQLASETEVSPALISYEMEQEGEEPLTGEPAVVREAEAPQVEYTKVTSQVKGRSKVLHLVLKSLSYLLLLVALTELFINSLYLIAFALNSLSKLRIMGGNLSLSLSYLEIATPRLMRYLFFYSSQYINAESRLGIFLFMNAITESLLFSLIIYWYKKTDIREKKRMINFVLIMYILIYVLKYTLLDIVFFDEITRGIFLMLNSINISLTIGLEVILGEFSFFVIDFVADLILFKTFSIYKVYYFLVGTLSEIDPLSLGLILILLYKVNLMAVRTELVETSGPTEEEIEKVKEIIAEEMEETREITEAKMLVFPPPIKLDYLDDSEFYRLNEEDKNILEALISINSFREAVEYLKKIKVDIDKSVEIIRYIPENYRNDFLKWYLNYSISINRPDIGAEILAALGRFEDIIPLFNAYAISRELIGDYNSIEGFKEWLKYLLSLYDKEDILDRIDKLKPAMIL